MHLEPIEIRYLALNVTAEVGANDAIIGVRVVPAGRKGHTVFGRTLAQGELDSGESVAFYPYAGEELVFPVGSVQFFLQDVDRHNRPGSDGYAPVANVLWTWLMVGAPPDPALFRFLFASARRLDTAHSLCRHVLESLTKRSEPFFAARDRLFSALGNAELMCVALGRTVDMLKDIPGRFSAPSPSVSLSPKISQALREIRNAFEHIEDRALGNVREKPHADALSIFDQRDFIANGVLRYATHSLDIRTDVLPLLLSARQAILDAAVAASGAAKTINVPLSFPAAPSGSYERILERAYFLWENKSGTQWRDADSNWAEAERTDAAIHRGTG